MPIAYRMRNTPTNGPRITALVPVWRMPSTTMPGMIRGMDDDGIVGPCRPRGLNMSSIAASAIRIAIAVRNPPRLGFIGYTFSKSFNSTAEQVSDHLQVGER